MPEHTACVTEDEAVALVQGELVEDSAERVRDHLDSCDACRSLVAALAVMPSVRRAAPVDTSSPTEPEVAGDRETLSPGSLVAGRYVIERVLGAGGMGVVYAARDATLERTVALKRVRGAHPAAQDRLVAEARAMARLAHPSVVAVFDTCVDGGVAYIAMEYVEGQTLRAWLAIGRSWREIADAFAQAARGLAAAHAVGIVHGDFKPDNVLVDTAGRVRVADFGLARAIGPRDSHVVGGTPAYMAPELLESARDAAQLERDDRATATPRDRAVASNAASSDREVTNAASNDRVGAVRGRGGEASDQYALCVSLYEAVRGKLPHAKGTDWPTVKVPGAIERVIERGMARDPQDRFASLGEVAAALAAVPRRRRQAIAIGIAGAIAIAAGAAAWTVRGGGEAPAACTDGAAELAAAWGPQRAEAIERAIAASGHPGGAEIAKAVVRTFDAYASGWQRGRLAACEATREGVQSPELLDRRMRCLGRRANALRTTSDLILTLDRNGLDRAVGVAVALPRLETCDDREALLDDGPQVGDADHAAITADIDRGDAEAIAGRYSQAATGYRAAVERAARVGAASLEAEAHFAHGDMLFVTGKLADADAELSLAIDAASRGRDDKAIASSLIALLGVVGLRHAQLGEVERLRKLAEGAVVRAGGEPRLRAKLHRALGVVYFIREDRANARDQWQRSLALRRELDGDQAVQIVELETNLALLDLFDGQTQAALAAIEAVRARAGRVERLMATAFHTIVCVANTRLGKLDAARAACEAARTAVVETLGPEHPDAGTCEINLGDAILRQGKAAEALPHFERGAAIVVRAVGAGHPNGVLARENLARVLRELGRLDDAARIIDETIASAEAAHGPGHVRVGILRRDRADLLAHRGKTPEATAEMLAALEVVSKARGDHVETAQISFRAGELLVALGRFELARTHLERSLAIRERELGPDHLFVAETRNILGGVLVQLGDGAAGVAQLERALPVLRAAHGERHATIANLINSLGEAYRLTNRLDDAGAAYEKSRAMLVALVGPDAPDVGIAVFNLGEVALAQRKAADALARYDEALALWIKRPAVPGAILAYGLTGRGEALVALGRHADAVAPLERALVFRQSAGDPITLAQTELALAEALLPRDRPRALQLVAAASARLRDAGPRAASLRERAARVR